VDSINNNDGFIFGNAVFVTKHITDWFNHKLLEYSGVKTIDDIG